MVENINTYESDPVADEILNDTMDECEEKSTEYMLALMCDRIMMIDNQHTPNTKMYKRGKYPEYSIAFDYVMEWLTNGTPRPDELTEEDELTILAEDRRDEQLLEKEKWQRLVK